MMLQREDLKRLRLSLALALALSAAGVGALAYFEQKLDAVRAQRKAIEERLKGSRDRLAKVAEEEQEIRTNLAQFRQFTDRGIVAGERRLEWIEALASIRQELRLFEVSYSVEREQTLTYPGVKNPETLFRASRLKLGLSLLHEEDLLRFLTRLGADKGSFSVPRKCAISRIERDATRARGVQPRLRAECEVDMITLRLPETKP